MGSPQDDEEKDPMELLAGDWERVSPIRDAVVAAAMAETRAEEENRRFPVYSEGGVRTRQQLNAARRARAEACRAYSESSLATQSHSEQDNVVQEESE